MRSADIRVSNGDRDEALSTLSVHMVDGRLELAEYEERCGQVTAARTRGELEALFTDLPEPHPDLSLVTPPGQLVRKAGQLVSRPARGKKVEPAETSDFDALEVVILLAIFLGIPAAIVLAVFFDLWWVFVPVTGMLFVGSCYTVVKNWIAESRE